MGIISVLSGLIAGMVFALGGLFIFERFGEA